MKIVKIATLACAFVLSAGVFAQEAPKGKRDFDPKKFAELKTERMTEDLELTAEQKAKVLALHEQMAQKRKEEQENKKVEQAKFEEELKSILTEEQYAKHLEKRKQHKGRILEKRKEHKQG